VLQIKEKRAPSKRKKRIAKKKSPNKKKRKDTKISKAEEKMV